MSWSTVAWYHTGRPSWEAAGWDDKMGAYSYWSKTHLIGYDDDATTNEYGERATLCGSTIPGGHMVYRLPLGDAPTRAAPACGRCARIARGRGLGAIESYARR